MNIEILTDDELIRYLDNNSQDPVIRRLVKIFYDNDEMIFQQLVDAGMDKDGYFETDCEYLPVGKYIEHLRNELAYYQREVEDLEYRLDDEKEKSKRLGSRAILDVMRDLKEQIDAVDQKAQIAERERRLAVEARDLAREQLRSWNHLRNPA